MAKLRSLRSGKLVRNVVATTLLLTAFVPGALGQAPLASLDWTQEFGVIGFTPANDVVRRLTVDSNGSVYAVGETEGVLMSADGVVQASTGGVDAFVRKYNALGEHEWTRQFGTALADRAVGVAVDGTGVYVTGVAGALPGQTVAGDRDAFLRKYDFNGNELWTREFGSTALDFGSGVASDGVNVVVCGNTSGALPGQATAGGQDVFVRKFDTSGNTLWTRQFGTNVEDVANDISIFATDIYVAGQTLGALPGQTNAGFRDPFVSKYAADGTSLWTSQFGTNQDFEPVTGVAVDGSGVYVVGQTNGAFPGQTDLPGTDSFIRKCDIAQCAQEWIRQFGTGAIDNAGAVSIDATGIYVTGQEGLSAAATPIQSFVYVRKFDVNGSEVAIQKFSAGMTTGPSNLPMGVSVNPSGVHVAGQITGGALSSVDGVLPSNPGLTDAFLRKYVLNLTEAWTRQFGGVGILTTSGGGGAAIDPAGNGYIAGSVGGALTSADGIIQTSSGVADVFVRKYAPNGVEIWTRQFGTSLTDSARAVAADASGVYVAGMIGSGPVFSQADAFVRKYDFSGTMIWHSQFGSSTLPAGEFVNGISVDASGVYVQGTTNGDLGGANQGGFDVFVRKYDFSGSPLWTRHFGTSAGDLGEHISADASGIYAVGQTSGLLTSADGTILTNTGGSNTYVRKYNSNGTEIWTRQFSTTSVVDVVVRGISATADGVFVSGQTDRSLSGQTALGGFDAFLRKYDFSGNEIWTRQFGSVGADFASYVSAGPAGVVVSGWTSQALPGFTNPNPGTNDAFVRAYNFDGTELWTLQMPTVTANFTSGVGVRAADVYLAGTSGENASLTHITLQDGDGNGIQDSIQTGPNAFSDTHSPVTSGTIVDRRGLQVYVADSLDPAEGVVIIVGPGAGSARFRVCNITLNLSANSRTVVECGSLTLNVIAGSATAELDEAATTLGLQAGAAARIIENASGPNSVALTSGTVNVTSTIGSDTMRVVLDGGATTVDVQPGALAAITENSSGSNLVHLTSGIVDVATTGSGGTEILLDDGTTTVEVQAGASARITENASGPNSVELIAGEVTVESNGTATTQILLNGGGTTVDVEAGESAGVTKNADGTSSVENLGSGDITVTSNGTTSTVTPGQDIQAGAVFDGFFAPLTNGVLNPINAGSSVPLKWRLTKPDLSPISNLASVAVSVISIPCDAGTVGSEVPADTVGSGLQNLGNGYYQFNWKTSKTDAGSCKEVRLNMDEWVVSATARFTMK